MKKRKIVIFSIILIIVLLFILGNYLYNRKQGEKFSEALEYYQCTYYTTTKSKENEFEKDVYVKIPHKPVDDYGVSNQYYYEQIIKTVATLLEKTNFRIIDEENDILLRVRFENGSAKYTINGDNNYYENKKAEMATKNNNKKINLNIKSSELIQIEDNDWRRAETREKIGNAEKNEDDYDIYESKGFKFKSINIEIYNIIFTKNYKNEVFEGIGTGLDNSEIRKILGKPNFENEDANMLIGYLVGNHYVFFSNGEISIYRIKEFDKSKNDDFSKLVTQLLNNKDYNKFLNELTEVYPDYAEYNKNENGIEIKYPHLGFKINFKNSGKSGITLYNNYAGKITEEIGVADVGKGVNLPSNILYENTDGVFEYELQRLIKTIQKNRTSNFNY